MTSRAQNILLSDLPLELISEVVSYLPIDDIPRLSTVSSLFEYPCKRVYLSHKPFVYTPDPESILRVATDPIRWFVATSIPQHFLHLPAESVLQRLVLTNCADTVDLKRFRSLKILELTNTPFQPISISDHPYLEKLTVVFESNHRSTITCIVKGTRPGCKISVRGCPYYSCG